MTKHLHRHRLECLDAAGARSAVHAAERVHVAACDPCAVRKRALDRARQHYLEAHPAADFVAAVQARAALSEPAPSGLWLAPGVRLLLGVAAAAAVVAVVALLALARVAPRSSADAIGLEGSVAFQIHARHADRTFALRDGDSLQPGDQLAFTYALSAPRHLLLLGIDDAGTVTRYFPAQGSSSQALAPTRGEQLPVGIELDARRGAERIFALFSAQPLDETAARRALDLAFAQARDARDGSTRIEALSRVDLDVDADAEQVSIWFRKP